MYAWSSEYLEIPDSGDTPPYSVLHGVPQDGAPSDALEQHYDGHGIVFAAVCGNILVCRRYLNMKRSPKQACIVPET